MGQVHGGGRGREGEETQRNETGRIKGGRGDRVGEKDGRMMKGDWRAKRKSERVSAMGSGEKRSEGDLERVDVKGTDEVIKR
jgi:hypothetical protein